MTAVERVAPPEMRRLAAIDVRVLEERLKELVGGDVRFDPAARGAYSTDGSNYRQVPIGVVVPATVEDGARAVRVCHELGVPVVSRGGGTSLAGQACNVAVVVDWSRYCNRMVSFDRDARTAVVEPGIVLDDLNRQLADAGLEFQPQPATHGHCTLGGMIGNNSCGATAMAYGTTKHHVRRLEVLTVDGVRMWVGPTSEEEHAAIQDAGGRRAEIYRGLRELVDRHADAIRERFPDIPRRVSGYNLDSLLPENGFDLAKALVGSESTLVTVLHAELELAERVPEQAFVVLGYPSIEEAAYAAPRAAEHHPLVLEGMDDRLIHYQREEDRNREALRLLPEGEGWLVVGLGADSHDELERRIAAVEDDLAGDGGATSRVFRDERQRTELWEVREAALGATAQAPEMPDTWPGWEDSAVPPERLGEYLRAFGELLDRYGYGAASRYGHFGQGCLHIRIPFQLTTASGVADFRAFIQEAAELVSGLGGSLSGEHGDGQARAALLPLMFGDEVVHVFEEVKDLLDPANLMNPGKVVRPHAPDENLRLGSDFEPATVQTWFRYTEDENSFARAAQRCVGVGKCRNQTGAVMCPSYRATGAEEHSTRGRARLLFEMLDGHGDSPVQDGWASQDVHDALDLCLACKGCKHDCPVEVDMATYKVEFLAHHYAGRLRPGAHYAMGWLPVWARAASFAPEVVNLATRLGPLTRTAQRLAGVEKDRPVPRFAKHRFVDSFHRRGSRGDGRRGTVMLWPDTFTNNFHPEVGRAAVRVLEDAGYRVTVPDGTVCCGLTWITTGQLGIARRVLGRTVAALADHVRAGGLVVGLEPSCTAVFRSDAQELMPHDEDLSRLADQTRTLAEVLVDTDGWEPPQVGRDAVVQPHCHQHAVLGTGPDEEVLRRAGVSTTSVGGCCGLAGSFGYEPGHLDVSVACAEHELMPALRDADPGSLVLADGFSCRTQIEQLGGGTARHLAEVLAAGLARRDAEDLPRNGRGQIVRHLDRHTPAPGPGGWPR
ncbi:MAG: FAD-binding protein [Frankiales bacterium]|nr:FAD-binding protein [Frankiales bacterium]